MMTTLPAPAEVSAVPSVEKLAPLSPAERMRRTRERRRKGLRLLEVELYESEIDAFVLIGLLPAKDRAEPEAIRRALYAFLHDRLLAPRSPFHTTKGTPAA